MKLSEQEFAALVGAMGEAAKGDPQKYGSMLSSFVRALFSGQIKSFSDAWVWVTNYAFEHWGLDLRPTPPTPVPAAGLDTLKGDLLAIVNEYKGVNVAKAAIGSGTTVPEALDWLIDFLRSGFGGKEIQLAVINLLLTVVIPALKAKGAIWAIVLSPVEVWLRNKKAELEAG